MAEYATVQLRLEGIMKRLCFLLLLILITFTSCIPFNFSSKLEYLAKEENEENKVLDDILEAVESGENENLKNLFSKKTTDEVPDLDEQIDALFEFFKGEVKSTKDFCGQSSEDKECRFSKKWYIVETTETTYYIYYIKYFKDVENPDNVGVSTIRVVDIKGIHEVEITGYTTYGSDLSRPGITIIKAQAS